MKAKRIRSGIYAMGQFTICKEEFFGPEGGLRKMWSIGRGGFAVPENPQLETLKAAVEWINAIGDPARQHQIERDNEPRVWGK